MVYVIITTLIISFFLYLIWNNYYRVYKYWELYGIPQPPGAYFLFGHMWPVVLQRVHLMNLVWEWHERYKDYSMVGFNDAGTPALLLRDPQLIKDVLQAKFECFGENGYKFHRDMDPNGFFHPAFSSGREWLVNRKRMTHAFSQKNLNLICERVRSVCGKLQLYLRQQLGARERLEMELKSLAGRFTAEVSANATLGVEGNSFEEGNHSLSFHALDKSIFEGDVPVGETFLLLYPKMCKILRARFIPKWVLDALRKILRNVLAERAARETPRNNTFFDIVMNLNRTDISREDMVSIVIAFLTDTYETTNIVASFALFDLSCHPDIQEKVRQEIRAVLSRYPEMGGRVSYEAAKDLQYTEQVIYESMRLHPLGDLKYRVCTKECDLKGHDGLCCHVEPGTEVFISSFGLQHDPQYWTEPLTFNPDRFAPENLREEWKYVFMPFGEGPRKCVGMKLGLFNVKSILLTILQEYVVELSPRTKVPVELDPKHITAHPLGGLWAYLTPLSKTL